MKKLITTLSLAALFMPLISQAHPGHGDSDGYTIIHYFREPVHAVIPLVVFIVILAYIHLLEKRYEKNHKR